MNNITRSRWAAIGAAVAVTLGAGGLGIARAASDSADGPVSAYFPIEPCRLAENETIGADASVTFDGWGTTGTCALPTGITGLVANVTATNASQQTNIRFYAAGDSVPGTANLNPSPGSAPTPNAVNIPLDSGTGQFSVYNRFGSVGVFIDVMGYYDDHTHDDRYNRFDRTIIVNGGDTAVANGTALIDAVAAAGSNAPSATDPWTVFVEPGVFELTADINVPDHVSITGSGIDVTTITSSASLPGLSMIEFGIGSLRDLTVNGVNQFNLVESDGSLHVESVKFELNDGNEALDLTGGPHTVVDSAFVIDAVLNGTAIAPTDAELHVDGSSFTSLGGSSVELIYMDGGDVVIDHSTFDGDAIAIFNCCSVAGGTLTVRHSAIDVGRRGIVANLAAIDLEIESSTILAVATGDVVSINAPGGSILMRGSTLVGGTGVGGTGAPTLTCRGTTTETGFLTDTCP